MFASVSMFEEGGIIQFEMMYSVQCSRICPDIYLIIVTSESSSGGGNDGVSFVFHTRHTHIVAGSRLHHGVRWVVVVVVVVHVGMVCRGSGGVWISIAVHLHGVTHVSILHLMY